MRATRPSPVSDSAVATRPAHGASSARIRSVTCASSILGQRLRSLSELYQHAIHPGHRTALEATDCASIGNASVLRPLNRSSATSWAALRPRHHCWIWDVPFDDARFHEHSRSTAHARCLKARAHQSIGIAWSTGARQLSGQSINDLEGQIVPNRRPSFIKPVVPGKLMSASIRTRAHPSLRRVL